jgi:hypothetical protein
MDCSGYPMQCPKYAEFCGRLCPAAQNQKAVIYFPFHLCTILVVLLSSVRSICFKLLVRISYKVTSFHTSKE